MGIVRNHINIEGITREKDLLKNENGHTIIYSEAKTLFLPEDKPEIKSIYEILISIDIKSHRSINTPVGKIVILDGVKKYKIIYTENSKVEKISILNLDTTFNTFTELPQGLEDIWNLKIHVIDAYFSVINPKKIYGHFLYLLDVNYNVNYKEVPSETPPLNTYDGIQIKSKPLKNMYEELSISEDIEKHRHSNPLIDLDEEIL
ncbi:hypothetical protein R9X47_05980 [Wukongibacter baidiensis]|uniref:hypothetical protein n=1 Tax=Wukongibacter baidiensis TaxID=1723361 RepID=UPI003D7F6E7F